MTLLRSCEQDGEKRAAAARAVAEVEDGMVHGLGSGSTAAFAIETLAARIAKGLRVVAIPSSETAATLARQLDGNYPLPFSSGSWNARRSRGVKHIGT